ncbi:beta-propeller domain-containing protein [Paenibacillus sp. J2TS4]|uniref:beta-propeller domain-containing protein n=1 Tax=Paenibacillus sp. J2TS4 TaxID=2807194 RepID=UPI001B2A58BC|nr:beta-propeller domain-containing protein [Paenibacillus sp. J2TS4]GIP33841.1 hypothetical protein J2TS4_30510 [Paenibacillus sp. J2TS4]
MQKSWWMPALLIVMMVSLVSSSFQTSTAMGSEYPVVMNGETVVFETAPYQVGSTMMVPLREWAEALGASVQWDSSAHTATAALEGQEWKVTLHSSTTYRNGAPMELEQPATLQDGRMMVPLRAMSEALGYIVKWDSAQKQVLVDSENHFLPQVGSYEKLKSLLASTVEMNMSGGTLQLAESAVAMDSISKAKEASSADFSATNIQVQGVDEGDLVKTDGNYIYQVNGGRIIIAAATPADDLHIVATLDVQDVVQPTEIYVDDSFLIVVGSAPYRIQPQPLNEGKVQIQDLAMPRLSSHTTKAVIYSLENREKPTFVREVELEGGYVASRKIGESFYLVTNQYIDVYAIMNERKPIPAPFYRDTAQSEEPIQIGYEQIKYFPDFSGSSYLHVAGFRLNEEKEPVNVSTYLGAGEQVYASREHLYVTLTQYEEEKPSDAPDTKKKAISSLPVRPLKSTSQVYKFRLDEGKVRYAADGTVPGTPINQFAMDEHNGVFRIATTTGDMWRTDEYTSKNNLYVLDETMSITGQIEGIAPGERIYSVRFMGDKGYMVTFKTVDPLFALDLSDPTSPQVLGALKIPGYSDYLHPYDENHLIGFGKEAVEVTQKDSSGRAIGQPQAYYQGMKVALFDVSDMTQPIELFSETIGDRGTESELLYNHRALLFSKEKNLLAFPVTVAEISEANRKKMDPFSHGDFTFQGAYVYSLDPDNGFQLRGKVTHLTEEDRAKAGQSWYDSRKNVQRILYIGDTLYTLSPSEIRASDLNTLEPIQNVAIPEESGSGY